ncbi:MAG: ribosome assembly RNA-binding protein YhbY [Polyangiaceae bacterium]
MSLTGKQTRHLRALGHHLDPVVQIGKNGITEALVAQLAEAIAHHELIKVRLLPECPLDRREAGEEVAAALEAELAQTLGRTLLFWKRNPQSAKVSLPNARGELKLPASQEASKGKKPSSRERAGARKPSAQGERNAPVRRARRRIRAAGRAGLARTTTETRLCASLLRVPARGQRVGRATVRRRRGRGRGRVRWVGRAMVRRRRGRGRARARWVGRARARGRRERGRGAVGLGARGARGRRGGGGRRGPEQRLSAHARRTKYAPEQMLVCSGGAPSSGGRPASAGIIESIFIDSMDARDVMPIT